MDGPALDKHEFLERITKIIELKNSESDFCRFTSQNN
jgi:hypothetical protein